MQKSHTIKNKLLDVKKAISKQEMDRHRGDQGRGAGNGYGSYGGNYGGNYMISYFLMILFLIAIFFNFRKWLWT